MPVAGGSMGQETSAEPEPAAVWAETAYPIRGYFCYIKLSSQALYLFPALRRSRSRH